MVGKGPIDFANNTQDIFLDVQPTSTLLDPNPFSFALSNSSIEIRWANADLESGYRIFRSTDNATFTQIADLGADITSYVDVGLTSNTVYYYYVEVYDATVATTSNTILDRTFSDFPESMFEDFNTFGDIGQDFGRAAIGNRILFPGSK